MFSKKSFFSILSAGTELKKNIFFDFVRRYFESTASTEFFQKIIFFDFVCRYFESNTGTDIFLKKKHFFRFCPPVHRKYRRYLFFIEIWKIFEVWKKT